MSVKYASQRCDTCGGTVFEYLEKLNLWECAYCGNRIERFVQDESKFTINNVVRQVLIDVSYRRFNEAKSNLTECEKIDSKYVGTIIAKICYLLNAAMYDSSSQQEKRNMFAQIKKYYGVLCERGDKPGREEYSLYEFLDSAEAVGTLILVYDTLNAQIRAEAIYKFFKPEEIYSLQLNSNLLRFMLNHKKYDLADKIVANCDNIDKRSALLLLLEQYPDTEQKVKNCSLLISQNVLTADDKAIIEGYLNDSKDNVKIKQGIACAALSTDSAPAVKCISKSIVSQIDNKDDVKRLLDVMMSRKLLDSEIYAIIEYAFVKCNEDVALYIVEQLKESKQFVVLNQHYFALLLENKNISYPYKEKIIDIAIGFNVNEKTKEQFISHYLNNISDEPQKRKDFLAYLFGHVSTLSTMSIEKYVLSNKSDDTVKPEIVEMIFSMDINKAFFRDTLDKYISSAKDSNAVSLRIIECLIDKGLKASESTMVGVLANPANSVENRIEVLRKLKRNGAGYATMLDKYIVAVSPAAFSAEIFKELLENSGSVSSEAFVKYLIYIKDTDELKSKHAKKLMEKCRQPVLTQMYKIKHLSTAVECTLLQAYILLSTDKPAVTRSVLHSLEAYRTKLNSDIIVNGSRKKYKKYLASVKGCLSDVTVIVSRELGLI